MEMENKTKGELLREELFYTKKSVFEVRTLAELDEAREYAKGYAEYLDNSKTEREAVITTIKMLKERGYTEYSLGDKVV
ncbi:MAG: aminopeptidase, partial [Clostridia bacterium]|nr:aminopeptidase [Clostridia bacterium]